MRRATVWMLTALSCTAVAVIWAFPLGPMGHGNPLARWWVHPRIQERLQLTPDQIDQLDAIHAQYAQKIIDLRAEVEKARLVLERAMTQTAWNESEILDAARRLMERRNQMELTTLQMVLEMRRVLTPEQWQKLIELRHRMQQMRRHFRQRRFRKQAPGGPEGPRSSPQAPEPPTARR